MSKTKSISIILVILLSNYLFCQDIYVSPTGNDATGDGTIGNPYTTTEKAGTKVVSAGATIYLRGGIYNWQMQIKSNTNGTATQPITIRNYPGEEPIIDGSGLDLSSNSALLNIARWTSQPWMDYYVIDGITVRNSSQRGISYYKADHLIIRNCKVHDISLRSIGGYGTNTLIENNTVYNGSLMNQNGILLNGGWPIQIQPTSDYATDVGSSNVVIRNNFVYNSWGEGITPGGSTQNAIVENNRVANVWSVGIYLDKSANITISNNHIWNDNPAYYRSGQPANGVGFSNETAFSQYDFTSNNIYIYNNLMSNSKRGISFWYDASNNVPANTYYNIYIAYNVIYNPTLHAIHIDDVPSSNTQPYGCILKNNIMYKGQDQSEIGNLAGWTISHNNWVGGIPAFGNTNSFDANPLFVNSGVTNTPADFKLVNYTSPCYQAGTPVPAITEVDFWNTQRNSSAPTIGLHEVIISSNIDKIKISSNAVVAYPNPSTNFIKFQTKNSQNEKISVYNSNGQLLIEKSITNLDVIDVSNFSRGVYYIRLSSNPSSVLKFIKIDN